MGKRCVSRIILIQCGFSLLSLDPGPKSPGLIILEHELTLESVSTFKFIFPSILKNGWKFVPVTQLWDDKSPYKNTDASPTGKVNVEDILGNVNNFQAASNTTSTAGSGGNGDGTSASTSPSASPSATGGGGKPNSAVGFANMIIGGTNWLLGLIVSCLIVYVDIL